MGKRKFLLVVLAVGLFSFWQQATAQCSICTKTAQQLGEKPAQGLNAGIMYLAFTPFIIVAFVAWRWWKNNKKSFDH